MIWLFMLMERVMPKSPLLSWIGSKRQVRPLALVRQDGHVPVSGTPPHELPDARQFGLRNRSSMFLPTRTPFLGSR